MWVNFDNGTKLDESSLLQALFYIGKIKKLTNKLDEACKTLNEVQFLMRGSPLLYFCYPVVFVETNLLLAEICVAQDKHIEACTYLIQCIPVTDRITNTMLQDHDVSYMYKIIYRLLKNSIDHYVPNSEMRKKEHVSFNDFLGRYYFKSGDYKSAYEAFTKTLELAEQVNDDSPKTRQELKLHQGQCKIRLEEYQEAIDIFKTILVLQPNSPHGHNDSLTHHISTAYCQFKLGNVTDAKCIISKHIISCFVEESGGKSEMILESVRKCEQKAYNREESKFLQEMLLHESIQQCMPKDVRNVYSQFNNSLNITRMIKYQVDKKHLDMVKDLKDCTCYQHKF
jgi:tetratricopeptide (TPR) repeat protein